MLDVDGTITNYQRHSLPSKKVTLALRMASRKIHICFVTGRDYEVLLPILHHLKIPGLCVCKSGSQVRETQTGKLLWEKPIDNATLEKVITVLEPFVKKIYHGLDQELPSNLAGSYHALFTSGGTLEEAKKMAIHLFPNA